MDIPSWLDKFLSEPVAIATLVLALVTAILAVAAFKSIRENRRIRKEDRESEFKAKALNNIERWIKEALEVKSEYIRVPRFEVVDSELLRRVEIKRDVLVSQNEYITMQAKLFDSEFTSQINLTSKIGRLAFLLESIEKMMESPSDKLDFDRKSTEALKAVFEIRAKEKL